MNTQESNSPHEKDLPRWLTIGGPLVALFLLVVAFGYYFYNFHGSLSPAHDKWGQFGDFIGGVLNPLFGFLAFILLLSTLHLQNRELQNSSHELAKSAEALKLQHDALVLQNFENTFFQLLRRIGDLVNQTRYFSKTGRDAFRDLYSEQLCDGYSPQFVGSDRLKNVVQAYEAFYSEYRRELGHYFRSLYHVFTFIDRSHLADKDKSIYANIAHAQLSTYERRASR